MAKRKKIPAKLRAQVLKEGGYKCACCGATDDLTIDHIVAVKKGGTNERRNLQVLCRECNSRKRTKRTIEPNDDVQICSIPQETWRQVCALELRGELLEAVEAGASTKEAQENVREFCAAHGITGMLYPKTEARCPAS